MEECNFLSLINFVFAPLSLWIAFDSLALSTISLRSPFFPCSSLSTTSQLSLFSLSQVSHRSSISVDFGCHSLILAWPFIVPPTLWLPFDFVYHSLGPLLAWLFIDPPSLLLVFDFGYYSPVAYSRGCTGCSSTPLSSGKLQ